MMAISWIIYGLIHWQPDPPCHDPIGTLSTTSCWAKASPLLEIYYLWMPPQYILVENQL